MGDLKQFLIHKDGPPRHDHLYFDLNNLLYGTISNTSDEATMFQRLFSYLDLVYSFSKPETVFLGVDGPGPLAKILTQRARRMDRAKNEGDDSSSRLPNAIDTLQFTPGTTFMERLTQYLHYYAGRRVITTSDRPLRVYVSEWCGRLWRRRIKNI